MPDQHFPDLRNIGCLAVVLGACGYSQHLDSDFKNAIGHYRTYCWVQHFEGREYLNPFDLEECIKKFAEDGITHIMCAGSVRLDFLELQLIGNCGGDQLKLAKGQELLKNPYRFYREFIEKLRQAGLSSISVREILHDYRARFETMGRVQPPAELTQVLLRLRAEAEASCSKDLPLRWAAQAVILDYHEGCLKNVTTECQTTNEMLLRAQLKVKPEGAVRIMIKIMPDYLVPGIDDPTIGPDTIDKAIRAKVDLIALDGAYGVIIGYREVIQKVDAGNIALIGI